MTSTSTSNTPITAWTFGPYSLDTQGQLRLGPMAVHLPPLQRRLLLSLLRQRGQVLSRENLLQEVWGHANVSEVSISRTVHGLRRAFAQGPLGAGVIRTIYGGGYRLEVPIHGISEEESPSEEEARGGGRFPPAQTLRAFVEGLVWVRQRDPRLLIRAEGHLRRCLEMAPDFTPALVQLAATQLAQYRWGLLTASSLENHLESLLQRAESTGQLAAEVLALRVEALSLLHWQPQLAEERFASWLPSQLLAAESRHSWVRHLLATGRAAEAIPLLEPHLTGENPDGWMLAATAWWLQGEHERGIHCLQKQLHIDGTLVAARLLLALQLADCSRTTEALRELEATGIATDHHAGMKAIVALVLALCGKRSQAQARLQAALGGEGQTLPMTSLWGLTALTVGDGERAAALLERAVQERCGLAPFVQHMPCLRHHGDSQVLAQFRSAMANRFRCTF